VSAKIKNFIKKSPFLTRVALKIRKLVGYSKFPGSTEYWESRYQKGGSSGAGSYNQLAKFKAEFLNKFVAEHDIISVMEFGSGDGNQLALFNFPIFIGLDVSKKAIAICMDRYKQDRTKSFFLYDSLSFIDNVGFFRADLVLSLDVIYHLIEDQIYNNYMTHLFNSAKKYVIIYSSNFDGKGDVPHIKHRNFESWVKSHFPNWSMIEKIDNPYPFDPKDSDNTSNADFYVFKIMS